jgi:ubiquinone/menaquinone biosynthesis C-methylase UbiE
MINTAKAFSQSARNYDNDFTNSGIGRIQRNAVWQFLSNRTSLRFTHALELNGGTGEDALWLADKCKRLMVTDISETMVEIASKRIDAAKLNHVKCKRIGFSEIYAQLAPGHFDLIFSDFGGLNCIDEEALRSLLRDLSNMLEPNGKIVLVLMGKYCLWESFYFLLKGNAKKAFRRWHAKGAPTTIEHISFTTWYFSVRQLRNMLPANLKISCVRPVAFAVPPSYLEPFFARYKILLLLLRFLDRLANKLAFLANMSDHFIVMLEPKNKS